MMKTLKTNKEIGDYGEKIAARYLRLHGYSVKERNWRAGHLEIDIIASNAHDVAFVEVKTRSYTQSNLQQLPPPKRAVDAEKQRLTRSAAQKYLRWHPTGKQPRMDVIEISLLKKEDAPKYKVAKIHHIKAAF